MNTVFFKYLGVVDFKEAWDYQESLLNSTINIKRANRVSFGSKKKTKSYLLFCQHPHVYTLGKSGDEKNLLLNKGSLKDSGADFYKINRGGDITYHGPGQLVVYPIFDLDNFFTDIHRYLRYLEEVVILVLKKYGINGSRVKGATGVWVCDEKGERKICAMGVRASRWVTMHGLAFNFSVDLKRFGSIVPCGIKDKSVTSLDVELGRDVLLEDVVFNFKHYFKKVFQLNYKPLL
jgi:lipoyl(octanoyl) transferase